MRKDKTIYVAGGGSMVGLAIIRTLTARGFQHVLGGADDPLFTAGGPPDPQDVERRMARMAPSYVIVACGRSRGIAANLREPATILLDNLLLDVPLIRAAHQVGVDKLLYLASSCCYPRDCPQPMRPESIWTGPPEASNHAYSAAKLAALALCQAYVQESNDLFIVGVPATPYGPGDHFDTERSHVAGALLHRLHVACVNGQSQVDLWGSGESRRDFIYADDLAAACVFMLENYDGSAPVNLVAPPDVSVHELARIIAGVVGYEGRLHFDSSRPQGAVIKVLDGSVIAAMGWKPATPLREGLEQTYRYYLRQRGVAVGVSP